MSGGARACSVFVGLRPGFGGLLLQGAGYAPVGPNGASPVAGIKVAALAATFGEKDSNYAEGPRMKRLFGDRMELFEFRGGTSGPPRRRWRKPWTPSTVASRNKSAQGKVATER